MKYLLHYLHDIIMNSHQAKQIDLPNLMSRLGYEPTAIKKGGNEYWYRSPFRSEKDASFHTSYLGGKWIWKDFGDIGGTVIDFVMRHERLNSVKEALSYLEGIYPANSLESASRVKRSGTVSKSQPTLFSFQKQRTLYPFCYFDSVPLEDTFLTNE